MHFSPSPRRKRHFSPTPSTCPLVWNIFADNSPISLLASWSDSCGGWRDYGPGIVALSVMFAAIPHMCDAIIVYIWVPGPTRRFAFACMQGDGSVFIFLNYFYIFYLYYFFYTFFHLTLLLSQGGLLAVSLAVKAREWQLWNLKWWNHCYFCPGHLPWFGAPRGNGNELWQPFTVLLKNKFVWF